MTENTAESKYASWSSPESPFSIEYPLALLDEIRLTVSSSFHGNPRGGSAAGGVFFGTRQDNAVRIEVWRPVLRENPYDVAFSEKDIADFGFLLWSAQTDSSGNPLEPVGWFVPHPRGALDPTDHDQRIFEQFFPHPWQFTLILQSDLIGPTKGEFFTRNSDGQLSEHQRDREFVLEPLHAPRVHGRVPLSETTATAAGVPAPVTKPVVPQNDRRSAAVRARAELAPIAFRELQQPDVAASSPVRRIPGKSWILWLLVLLMAGVVIFVAAVTRKRLATEPKPVMLSLHLQDSPGAQLHVDWSKTVQPVLTARKGELEFDDGGAANVVPLDAAHLRLGTFTYIRHSGIVRVKLSVFGESAVAPAIEEVAEFTGAPPAPAAPQVPAAEREAWDREKADLQDEIKRLKGQLASEKAHRQEAQNLVRVLENRLELAPPKK